MNFQPPDPPEYGHCLNCKRCIDASEVRGDHCIECEEEPELLRCGCGDFGEANYFADDEPRFVCGGRWCLP